ncbi:PLC-like phosphodiesterase [Syncephalis fuscata]|nr:PLC-like phosphodiesterase [Syncephalis fuscata]
MAKMALLFICQLSLLLAAICSPGIQASIIPKDAAVPAIHQSVQTVFGTSVNNPVVINIDKKQAPAIAPLTSSETNRYAAIASDVTNAWTTYLAKQHDIIPPNNVHWPNTFTGKRTLLLAHRGARAFMPAHSSGAYYMAAMLSADYIEPDLVVSKDGHIICHHDLFLSEDTDVEQHPEFASRRRTVVDILEGEEVTRTDWFIEDFTLAELKTLRLRQLSKGVRPSFFDKNFALITLQEFLTLIQETSIVFKRPISIIPELKHGRHHAKLRPYNPHYFENRVLSILSEYGYPLVPDPNTRATRRVNGNTIELGDVQLQSFDDFMIHYLRERTALPLLYLVESTNADVITPKGLDAIKNVATYIGIDQRFLFTDAKEVVLSDKVPYNEDHINKMGGFIAPARIPLEIHNRGLRLSVYTVADSREINTEVPAVPERVTAMFKMGVDSIFTENLAETHRLRDAYTNQLASRRF